MAKGKWKIVHTYNEWDERKGKYVKKERFQMRSLSGLDDAKKASLSMAQNARVRVGDKLISAVAIDPNGKEHKLH